MSGQAIEKAIQDYIANEPLPFFRDQVQALVHGRKEEELSDRFYKDLEFGTGGMRGEIGGGTNRMNPYMIQKATQGLANYIKKTGTENPRVAIAYDSRHFSDTFAREAALVLAANNIETFVFTGLRPTPELSFAVRYLKATAGIVITASHNPKEYNGYKVYWSDGGQIISPHDKGIIAEVRSAAQILRMEEKEAVANGRLKWIDKEVDEPFIQGVKDAAIRPQLMRDKGKELRVVFTPLHGTGAVPVSRALEEMGIRVVFVEGQREPNGDFPTVEYPNPEEAKALNLAMELGKELGADLVMGTDPDADRLGVAVPDGKQMVIISGNQLGALLADYIFSGKKEMKALPDKPLFIKTIVTTEFQRKIAESYGALCEDVLTGFKFIGAKILEYEQQPDGPEFVFGGEESYGYLVHTQVRDKDAVSAATLTAEMALYHVSRGKSLIARLNELWEQFGYYQEVLISQHFKGQAGAQTMQRMMENLRTVPPKTWAGVKVECVRDFQAGQSIDPQTGTTRQDISLPSSNVLQFVLGDGSIVTARPSGTEPKIKFYASCHGETGMDLAASKTAVAERMGRIEEEIGSLIAKAQSE